jgi:hypothetical protein
VVKWDLMDKWRGWDQWTKSMGSQAAVTTKDIFPGLVVERNSRALVYNGPKFHPQHHKNKNRESHFLWSNLKHLCFSKPLFLPAPTSQPWPFSATISK